MNETLERRGSDGTYFAIISISSTIDKSLSFVLMWEDMFTNFLLNSISFWVSANELNQIRLIYSVELNIDKRTSQLLCTMDFQLSFEPMKF